MGLDRPVARRAAVRARGVLAAGVVGRRLRPRRRRARAQRRGGRRARRVRPIASRFAPFATDLGLLAEVRPVAWNAVGVPVDIPEALVPLLRSATVSVDLLTVRDEASKSRLEAAGVERPIDVVPDTAVLVDDVIPRQVRGAGPRAAPRRPTPARLPAGPSSWCTSPSRRPRCWRRPPRALVAVAHSRPTARFVLVALGETHGDGAALRSLAERIGAPPSSSPIPRSRKRSRSSPPATSSCRAATTRCCSPPPSTSPRRSSAMPLTGPPSTTRSPRRWAASGGSSIARPTSPPRSTRCSTAQVRPTPRGSSRLRRGGRSPSAAGGRGGRARSPSGGRPRRAHRRAPSRRRPARSSHARVESALRTDVAVLREHHDAPLPGRPRWRPPTGAPTTGSRRAAGAPPTLEAACSTWPRSRAR